MRKPKELLARIGGPAAITLLAVIALATPALAQFGSSGGQTQTTQAAQLPLSGRTGQTGGVAATQLPVSGVTTSVNTLNPTIEVQGPYSGSADSAAKMPFSGKLSLREAVQRAIQYNLGSVGLAQAVNQAHGQRTVARSALLPNVNGDFAETDETVNLAALGIHIRVPGFSLPTVVGPFQLHGCARDCRRPS